MRLLDLLAAAAEAVKAGGDARTQVELALLKAAKPEVDPSTKALLARIERLEAGGPSIVSGRQAGRPDTPAEVPAPVPDTRQRCQASSRGLPTPPERCRANPPGSLEPSRRVRRVGGVP